MISPYHPDTSRSIVIETGAAIVEVLTSLAGEQSVIIATHDERIAGAADRIIYLSDGRIGKDQVVSRQADAVAP